MRRTVYFVLSLFLAHLSAATLQAQEPKPAGTLTPGVVHPSVATQKDAQQTYALYLPSSYTPERLWPIVYAFDPGAHGRAPVERMKEAAEKYGYIVAGSNTSRNGAGKATSAAVNAMVGDTEARLAIDARMVYFAGFSGGARLASNVAQFCRCAAGVFLNGAGFSTNTPPAKDTSFAVFAAVGTADFNYPEVVQLEETLDGTPSVHWLRIFEGPHQWAPAETAEEALEWFRVLAMTKGVVAQDANFLKSAADAESARAQKMEKDGDAFAAWREYRQAAATFGPARMDEDFRKQIARLNGDKRVRDGAKREKSEFAEQDRLSRDISSAMASLGQQPSDSGDEMRQIKEGIGSLRAQTTGEKRPEKQRVYERALTGIFVQAMEEGNSRAETKDFARAANFYELAAEAEPDSTWALPSLAVARAESGDRKGAIAALKKAKEAAKDQEEFQSWLKDEPAFAKLRGTPEFLALLNGTSKSR